MSLKYGIVGLPNVGKSTLFSALAKIRVPAENYPFCTIDPQLGIVHVPDDRRDQLAALVNPKRIVPTTISFVDIAGLVKGASKGEGLGNQFLANIREVDAILHVVRCFDDEEIVHVAGGVDPLFDKEVIDEELRLKDLSSLAKRKERLVRLGKTGKPEIVEELRLVEVVMEAMGRGKHAREVVLKEEERLVVESWQLLTRKPVIYVANVDEGSIGSGNAHVERLKEVIEREGACLVMLCSAVEAGIALAPEEEQKEFLEMYGLKQTGLQELIQTSYRELGLITYFTAGEEEVRGWTIAKGTLAPQAAAVIHSDFERKFIKAEVIKFEDYLAHGGVHGCKQAGKMALEGKLYEVQDGDIIHFKHG